MSHEEIRPKGGELIVPQFGGQRSVPSANGKHYPPSKKGKGRGKSALTSPATEEKSMSQEDKASGTQAQVQEILDQIEAVGPMPVEIGTPPDEKEVAQVETTTPEKPAVVPEFPETVDQTLVKILEWKRPHESAGENHFVSWLHKELARRGSPFEVTKGGNVVVKVPYPARPDAKTGEKIVAPTVLFSCHTDTVHHDCNGNQVVMYDKNMGQLFLSQKKEHNPGSCLGADDGAGVWLCLEMIKAKVPGSYVFHRGEEVGGVGSRALLADNQSWIEQHDIAVAFDRKDTVDVVITQGGQACASQKFGAALAKALNDGDTTFDYKISHGGTFTDTKVYRNHIAECCNISVGYENAHSASEHLDYAHLLRLRHVLINLKWDSLPVERDPHTKEYVAPPYQPDSRWAGRGRGYTPGYENYKGKGFAGFPTGVDDDDYSAMDAHLADKAAAADAKKEAEKKLALVPKERAIVTLSRSSMEPAILDEIRSLTLDDIRDVAEDSEAAFSVITALAAELEAAYAKCEMYRSLASMD